MLNLSEFSGKRICVAVSGGVDSTALLYACKQGEKQFGYRLLAVHCEHGIRGEESLEDMRFVERLCADWQVPLVVFREDCPKRAKEEKLSLETTARNFRLETFSKIIKENKADFILTAHHQNDEAETVLFRLARGASLSGISGISEKNGWLVRPFLGVKKSEILAYAKLHNLSYREDETNYQLDATRNKIRHCVLPAMEDAVSGATGNIARFACLAKEDDDFLYEESKKLLSLKGEKYLLAFCDKAPLFRRACLLAIKGLGLEKDYTSTHLQAVFALQKSERGAVALLPKNIVAEKCLHGIELYVKRLQETLPTPCEKPCKKLYNEKGFDGGRYAVKVSFSLVEDGQNTWRVLKFDADKMPKDAVFRFRKEGDKIEKFGGGNKSLKKFFNEKKIPVAEREYLPLIASGEGEEVYAVCGVEIADKIKVTSDTTRVGYLVMEEIK